MFDRRRMLGRTPRQGRRPDAPSSLRRDAVVPLQGRGSGAEEHGMPRRMIFALLCALLPAALPLVGDQSASAASPHRGANPSPHRAANPTPHHALGRQRPRRVPHTVRHGPRRAAARARASSRGQRLRFGVYPWAGAGAVNQVDPPIADDPNQALRAVKTLQGGRSMTVHLYGQYTGSDPGEADALISDARWWSQNGVRVEMVLRYRPASPDRAGGYLTWVRTVAGRLAAIPGVVAIQVGNEANNTGSAAAGDGAYPRAVQAIASAIPAAREAVIAAGRPDIGIGFNWAAGSSPCRLDPFFSELRHAGGQAFTAAVSWVGIDVYPGTWSAPSPSADPGASLVRSSVISSLGCLREKQMASAALPSSTTITVAETGYPTGANRSEHTQASVLREIVGAVQSVSGRYGVTDLRWFDLRDANTGSGQLENSYGLLRDDYSPKPAFAAYQQLIAASGQ